MLKAEQLYTKHQLPEDKEEIKKTNTKYPTRKTLTHPKFNTGLGNKLVSESSDPNILELRALNSSVSCTEAEHIF